MAFYPGFIPQSAIQQFLQMVDQELLDQQIVTNSVPSSPLTTWVCEICTATKPDSEIEVTGVRTQGRGGWLLTGMLGTAKTRCTVSLKHERYVETFSANTV